MQEQANKEARAAAEAVSSNPKDLSSAALRREINERERKCKDMLHQHRFIRQTASRSDTSRPLLPKLGAHLDHYPSVHLLGQHLQRSPGGLYRGAR